MDRQRVSITAEAAEMVRRLRAVHGDLMFHQSGGCCDGSSPMCYPLGELRIGSSDVQIGQVEGCPVYIAGRQWEAWKHTDLIIDLVEGRGSGFSLEAPEGVRFVTRSVLCDADGSRSGPANPVGL